MCILQDSTSGDPPKVLICPLTMDLMVDPVMDANGHTFERAAINEALARRPGTDPLTNSSYLDGDARLTPNRTVRDMVDAFLESTGVWGAFAVDSLFDKIRVLVV